MTTLTYSGRLTVTTCWCGIAMAVPEDLYEWARLKPGDRTVWCPLGHKWVVAGESEATKLKRQLEWERDTTARLRGDLDQSSKSLSATRGVVTKLRKRAVAGTCPFGCKRHFANVERHVATMHPDGALDVEVPS